MEPAAADKSPRAPAAFFTTRWSLILSAAQRETPEGAAALELLCGTYWYPLYAYARRRGLSADDAADQTQSFFVDLLEKPVLQDADRERGRFRSFLLTVFKRYLASEHERQQAQKRGGGRTHFSIDVAAGEVRYRFEPADEWTAEKLYERRWALTLLEQVIARLGEDYQHRGKQKLFEACRPFLLGGGAGPDYPRIATDLGMTETAVRVAVHRMRDRYRELLRDEVGQTVASSEELEDELQYLRSAIRGENA